MSFSRKPRYPDDEMPTEIKYHFYGRLFAPCCTRKHGKYLERVRDGVDYGRRLQWQGIVEDYVERNRAKMTALASFSIACFAYTYNSYPTNPVSGIISAIVGVGVALITAVEADRLQNEVIPHTFTDNADDYWSNRK